MADEPVVWVQDNPALDRDAEDQYFHSTVTGVRVYGRTDGTASDHIHLRFPTTGVNSGYNLDPRTGEVSKDGNLLGDIFAVGALAMEAAVGGAIGVGSAAVNASKAFFGPDGQQIDLTGLIFPPLPKQP